MSAAWLLMQCRAELRSPGSITSVLRASVISQRFHASLLREEVDELYDNNVAIYTASCSL